MNRFRQFVLNGLLLTAVSLVMRSVSVSFQVYLSNRIGAAAMGLFALISTVYGLGITVATSGIQFATTRLVAEAMGKKESTEKRALASSAPLGCILRKCIAYALCFGLGSALILYSFAPLIGARFLGDARTVMPLRVLSVTLPPIALSSVFNGYFTAVRRVYKNAVVQICSEAIRIFLCIVLLGSFLPNGVEYALLAIILGGAIAELFGFGLQGTLFLLERHLAKKEKETSLDRCRAQKKLLHIALPVAFSAYVRSALITIEHLLIPSGLAKSGSSRETSLASYGTVHGMVFPLIMFPAALSSSFAGLLVPEIAEASAANDQGKILRTIERVMESVLIYAIGVSGILMCFSYELGSTVYPGTDAAKYILMLSPLIPVMYLDTSVDAILKGLGQQVYHMGINILDSLLSVFLVIFLLPRFGILGYVMTVYFTELINSALSLTRLLQITRLRPKIFRWIIIPLGGVIASTFLIRQLLSVLLPAFSRTQTILHIVLAAILYLALIGISKHCQSRTKGKKNQTLHVP